MIKIFLTFFSVIFLFSFAKSSSFNESSSVDKTEQKPISISINAATCDLSKLDSLCATLLYKDIWFETDSLVNYHVHMPPHLVPKFSDEEISKMMALIPSTIPLDYNTAVKQYIEKFTTSRRSFIAKALGLSNFYFDTYNEVFDRHNMPLDFKYLSVIESGLNTRARSNMGATGLWQFMYKTGLAYGLQANSYIDERCDPILSTDAAARYLKDLYKIYGDWQMCMAAYNAGPGNVNKAIARSGGKRDYWSIRPFLPTETQNYVPQYIAVAFVMHYHDKYKILPLKPKEEIFLTDSIIVKEKLRLEYISEILEIDLEYLTLINPTLKTNFIPKTENGIALHLPIDYVAKFIENQENLFNDSVLLKPEFKILEVVASAASSSNKTVYSVKSGDTLGGIANRYKVKISQIKSWNNLKSDALKIGQKLVLYK